MTGTLTTAPRATPTAASRAWWAVLLLSLLVAAYGASYVARGEVAFVGELAESFRARPWGIIGHAAFGTLALLAGPLQFRSALRARHRRLHRAVGRVYVVAALGTGATGVFMSVWSFGGAVTHVGFGVLGVLVMATTGLAFARIRAGDVAAHRAWMVRSFALIFAGVTLRIELPLLIGVFGGEFLPAYRLVAWLSWVPNLAWAEWWVRRRSGVVPAIAPRSTAARAAAAAAAPRRRALVTPPA